MIWSTWPVKKTTWIAIKNIVRLVKIQDNIFFKTKYWNNNILDRSGTTRVNLSNLQFRSWDYDIPYKENQSKLQNSILNQPSVEEWNWEKSIKKSTWINMLSMWFRSWDWYIFIESKHKK
jgi:hypothetical protein